MPTFVGILPGETKTAQIRPDHGGITLWVMENGKVALIRTTQGETLNELKLESLVIWSEDWMFGILDAEEAKKPVHKMQNKATGHWDMVYDKHCSSGQAVTAAVIYVKDPIVIASCALDGDWQYTLWVQGVMGPEAEWKGTPEEYRQKFAK